VHSVPDGIFVAGRIKGFTFDLMIFFTTPVKLIIYSDARQNDLRNELGVLFIDHQLGNRWVSSDVCPTWLIETWSCAIISNRIFRQHINGLELRDVLAVVSTFGPQYMRNRQVLFFVDNTVYLTACVDGYDRSRT